MQINIIKNKSERRGWTKRRMSDHLESIQSYYLLAFCSGKFINLCLVSVLCKGWCCFMVREQGEENWEIKSSVTERFSMVDSVMGGGGDRDLPDRCEETQCNGRHEETGSLESLWSASPNSLRDKHDEDQEWATNISAVGIPAPWQESVLWGEVLKTQREAKDTGHRTRQQSLCFRHLHCVYHHLNSTTNQNSF